MRSKLVSVLLLLVVVVGVLGAETTRSLDGTFWNSLSSLEQKYIILGYLMCSQALYDRYGMIEDLEVFLHTDTTLQLIHERVCYFYQEVQNMRTPIYRVVTMANINYLTKG